MTNVDSALLSQTSLQEGRQTSKQASSGLGYETEVIAELRTAEESRGGQAQSEVFPVDGGQRGPTGEPTDILCRSQGGAGI